MLRGILGKTMADLGGLLLLQTAALAQEAIATPGCGSSVGTGCKSCQTHHCPPFLRWCQEGAPRLKFQHGCPKPICNPCELPNWGYYQTCWTPWPWPADYSHCIMPAPAAHLPPAAGMPPAAAMVRPGIGDPLPTTRKGL